MSVKKIDYIFKSLATRKVSSIIDQIIHLKYYSLKVEEKHV